MDGGMLWLDRHFVIESVVTISNVFWYTKVHFPICIVIFEVDPDEYTPVPIDCALVFFR